MQWMSAQRKDDSLSTLARHWPPTGIPVLITDHVEMSLSLYCRKPLAMLSALILYAIWFLARLLESFASQHTTRTCSLGCLAAFVRTKCLIRKLGNVGCNILPQLGRNVMSQEPFKISPFGHFRSLKTDFPCHSSLVTRETVYVNDALQTVLY